MLFLGLVSNNFVIFTADLVRSFLFMAAALWVAHEFNYTVSICGNDREAIFSDSVSVFIIIVSY